MTEANDLIGVLQKLGSAGFGVMLALILYGSFKEVWVWGRSAHADLTRLEAALLKMEKEKDEWKALCLKHVGINDRFSESVSQMAGVSSSRGVRPS